jgi:hypothetical protein
MLIDKRRHSSIIDVASFRGAGSDIDHYLVLAKLWQRLLVEKEHCKRSMCKKLSEKGKRGGIKEPHQAKISNRVCSL